MYDLAWLPVHRRTHYDDMDFNDPDRPRVFQTMEVLQMNEDK